MDVRTEATWQTACFSSKSAQGLILLENAANEERAESVSQALGMRHWLGWTWPTFALLVDALSEQTGVVVRLLNL